MPNYSDTYYRDYYKAGNPANQPKEDPSSPFDEGSPWLDGSRHTPDINKDFDPNGLSSEQLAALIANGFGINYGNAKGNDERYQAFQNYIDFLKTLYGNQFNAEQNDLAYDRSKAANQVALMMQAGMSRQAALAALSGGSNPTVAASTDPMATQRTAPTAVEKAEAVFSGLSSVANLASVGVGAAQLATLAPQLAGLGMANQAIKWTQTAMQGASLVPQIMNAAAAGATNADGTPVRAWVPDTPYNSQNFLTYARGLADDGYAPAQQFMSGYDNLISTPFGAQYVDDALTRWVEGSSDNYAHELAVNSYKMSLQAYALSKLDADKLKEEIVSIRQSVAESSARTRNTDAATELIGSQIELTDAQTAGQRVSNRFAPGLLEAQTNQAQMSAVASAAAANQSDAQSEYTRFMSAMAELDVALKDATFEYVMTSSVDAAQLLASQWTAFMGDSSAMNAAIETFLLDNNNKYLVAALHNAELSADQAFWDEHPQLATLSEVNQHFHLWEQLDGMMNTYATYREAQLTRTKTIHEGFDIVNPMNYVVPKGTGAAGAVRGSTPRPVRSNNRSNRTAGR